MSVIKAESGKPLVSVNFDSEFFQEGGKLVGWSPCALKDLKTGDHLRLTKNKYQSAGRTCSYCVVQKITKATKKKPSEVWINSFGETKYKDWLLDLDNPFKQIKIYRRLEKLEHTGFCIRGCGSVVKEPYYLCYFCRFSSGK